MSRNTIPSRRVRLRWLLVAHLPLLGLPCQPAAAQAELPEVKIEAERLPDTPTEPAGRASTLRGEALRDRKAGTLGETLSEEAGVHNASFGTGVGLPVIRGLGGARVKVLNNGGGTHDATTFSPDHASTADATLADSIRILRGPATIRYGGGAIGGVVDVSDERIPTRVPARAISGSLDTSFNRNGAERVHALRLDGGNALFALHGSALSRDRGDSRIAGCAIDDAAVEQQFGLINTRNSCGRLYNSDARSASGTLGGSVFLGNALFGAAVNNASNEYGIPPAPGHSHGGDDRVRIRMDNRRVDTRAEWLGDGWLQALRYTGGHIDYRHDEVDEGVVATTFRNKAIEQRLELEHAFGEHLSGTLGVHHLRRDFSALGAEAFIPQTGLRSSAVYAVQRVRVSDWTLDLGWRGEITRVQAGDRELAGGFTVSFPARRFNTQSTSAALSWQLSEPMSLTLTGSNARRAPDIHELYSLGPHFATRTYDIGDPDLKPETARSVELGGLYESGRLRLSANLFANDIDDYMFQRTLPVFYDTDEEQFRFACVRLEECLTVVQYTQSRARFRGFEAEAALKWTATKLGDIEWSVFGDRTRGRLTELGEDVPRLPAFRVGSQLALRQGAWSGRVRVTHHAAQDRPGANETTTGAYTLVSANLNHVRALGDGRTLTLFARGRNLLDREARNATSFLRNFSPEPGRSIEVGLSLTF
ncbi:tonB dependent receptor family protein [Methyloversatilis sp. RAC08]|uniref:TonB-dependent receptor n=1 Tax=Methyloversatilis sp. RAC08 TaxID=1842540 RepID=UPI00085698E0|nr:TonB-dependent receptor [Methyloversatilis sp. RAC08]AOF83664.1 tonB dependent receptor family protein [Methyloversatilis sp. RAC08]